MKETSLFVCLFFFALCGVDGLVKVIIDYSFRVPEKFGVATPESANCCPFGKLPKNDTQGMVPPTVIGIGVQKGGTTTLYDHFRVHPQMIGATKELHYLDSGSNKSYISYLQSWGRNQKGPWESVSVNGDNMTVVVPPKVGGLYEISPSYLLVPFSACKAKVIVPRGKFIVFLRDPTSRIYSGVSYTIQVMHNRVGNKSWMTRSFWSLVQQGMLEVGQEPRCNFQTGDGEFDFNDCWGCVLRLVKLQNRCAQRPFVTLTDNKGSYKCNFVGKEHVLRGMYGPQLSWWFTLHDPSQFKIINSNKFFEHPLEVMQDIGEFLGLHPTYTESMIQKSRKKSNVGHYRKEDPKMIDFAKNVLREFYRRPNLELYRLLHEAGHRDFEPFEKELQSMTLLNCSNPEVVASGVCGDPRFHKNHPEYDPEAGRLPLKVERAVYPVEPEDPKADAIAVAKETMGNSAVLADGTHQDFAQQSSTKVDGDTAEPAKDSLDNEEPMDVEEAFGTIDDDGEIERHEEETTDGQSDAAPAERSSAVGEKDLDKQSEVTSASSGDRSADSSWLVQSGAQVTVDGEEESTESDKSYLGFTFRKEEKLEQQAAQNGMVTADHFVHFMYGVVFTALLFYCYRWLKKRQRR